MSPPSPENFYAKSVDDIAREFQINLEAGLNPEEAQERLRKYGPNRIETSSSRSSLRILFDQLIHPMVLLLLAVIGISIVIGHVTDALIIALIVFLNTLIGFSQEFKAEKAMESIRRLASPRAKVFRGGRKMEIETWEVVPGDIVLIDAGDGLPADVRLFITHGLKVDESLLTGESAAIAKETQTLMEENLSPGDQINMGFLGTHAVAGNGRGICVATGLETELGRIASLVSHERAGEVPLQQRMEAMTRRLVLAAAALCLLIFFLGLIHRKPWMEMLLAAVSLGVAALPEGLPAVITISLSLGALRLAKRGVLVRRLQAVEALGSVTTICADKTGTLTLNRMEVSTCFVDGEEREAKGDLGASIPQFFQALVLCNDARLSQEGKGPFGDPMEAALLEFALSHRVDPEALEKEWTRIREIPFDARRKRMTTIHRKDGQIVAYLKGAPETVLSRCDWERRTGGDREIDPQRRQELKEWMEKTASRGLRILAAAMKEGAGIDDPEETLESRLTFLGCVGIQDPPRREVKEAIRACRSAGIQPVMITGDHPATAMAIGKELGIYREGDEVITGKDLMETGRAVLDQKALKTSLFARVTPEDKLRIIEVFKDDQQFVAMTGDGVNDAPALKKADVGIAMGRGADAAKEASALILVEENFSTIVGAIREGRVIYDNIRKFVRYMLTTNWGEIATMLLTVLFGLPLPVLPVQILWINLVTDGLPAVALGFEPPEGDVMARPPRDPRENILGRGLGAHVLWVGLLMGTLSAAIFFYFWSRSGDLKLAQTVAFTALVFTQMGHVMAIRSETRPLWKIRLFSNYRLLVAVALTVGVQALILYLPWLQRIFHTTPLSLAQLGLCFAMAGIIYLVVELEKFLRSKG